MSLETFAWVAGAFIGITYVVGGLIVNTYLARYRVTEYQILRAKYLAVGLVYLLNIAIDLLPASLLALLFIWGGTSLLQVAAILSLIASIWMFVLWTKGSIKRPVFRSWRMWVILSVAALTFPVAIVLRLLLGVPIDVFNTILLIEAALIGLTGFTAQTYYYSRFIYGDAGVMGRAFDPTGTGAPVWVQLSGEPDAMETLSVLGLPLISERLSAEVLMLDETEEYHIVGLQLKDTIKAVKIDKDIIKAILYHDYLKQKD